MRLAIFPAQELTGSDYSLCLEKTEPYLSSARTFSIKPGLMKSPLRRMPPPALPLSNIVPPGICPEFRGN